MDTCASSYGFYQFLRRWLMCVRFCKRFVAHSVAC